MRLYYLTLRAMGSRVSLQIETEADGTTILNDAVRHIATIEACLTRFRPDSDLVRLNTQAGRWVEVAPILFEAVQAAKHAAFLTDGLYHPLLLDVMIGIGYDRSFEHLKEQPKLPRAGFILDWHEIELRPSENAVYIPRGSALDLGGIGKGWAAERIADDLSRYGACVVNLGGDIAARGAPHGYLGWPVDVTEADEQKVIVSLSLSGGNIATSGTDYRRWLAADGSAQHHLIDPRTGQPAHTDVLSATVIHPKGALSEAFAKAVLLQGAQAGLAWLSHQWNTAGMVVKTNGEVIATPSFTPYITQQHQG